MRWLGSGDQEVIEAFAAQGADEAFGNRVGRGVRTGAAEDADVGADEHGVEGGGELAVPVADQEPELVGAVAEVHQQVAGLLGDPGAGGVGGDPGEVYAASGRARSTIKDVEAAEEDGVDVGEVDRKDRVSLRRQELPPGRAGPQGSGVDAGGREDLPDRGGRYSVAESDELTVNASVAPVGVLSGHSQHQGPDRLRRGRPARLSAREVQRRATRWACQRSKASAWTSRSRRSCVGSSLLSALRNARSIQVKVGCGLRRRRTATSCRSTRISTSLVASDRASSASQLNTRASIRYASRRATARDPAGRPASRDAGRRTAKALIRGRDTVLGTHRRQVIQRLTSFFLCLGNADVAGSYHCLCVRHGSNQHVEHVPHVGKKIGATQRTWVVGFGSVQLLDHL